MLVVNVIFSGALLIWFLLIYFFSRNFLVNQDLAVYKTRFPKVTAVVIASFVVTDVSVVVFGWASDFVGSETIFTIEKVIALFVNMCCFVILFRLLVLILATRAAMARLQHLLKDQHDVTSQPKSIENTIAKWSGTIGVIFAIFVASADILLSTFLKNTIIVIPIMWGLWFVTAFILVMWYRFLHIADPYQVKTETWITMVIILVGSGIIGGLTKYATELGFFFVALLGIFFVAYPYYVHRKISAVSNEKSAEMSVTKSITLKKSAVKHMSLPVFLSVGLEAYERFATFMASIYAVESLSFFTEAALFRHWYLTNVADKALIIPIPRFLQQHFKIAKEGADVGLSVKEIQDKFFANTEEPLRIEFAYFSSGATSLGERALKCESTEQWFEWARQICFQYIAEGSRDQINVAYAIRDDIQMKVSILDRMHPEEVVFLFDEAVVNLWNILRNEYELGFKNRVDEFLA